jgi:beta-galactosidase
MLIMADCTIGRRPFLQGVVGAGALYLVPRPLVALTSARPGVNGASGLPDRYPPIIPDFPHILHGADWNPDQWLHEPAVIDEDFRLMEQAGCNTFSLGIFAWAALEPEEGRFAFDWLDDIMLRLAEHDFYAFLATPSGGKPRWMSEKYPEIRRINRAGQREPHGSRHNHCFTSPVYREKVRLINTKLAERYNGHKALAGWHVSNEYSGSCYCDLCLGAFREWLKARYGSLDALNGAWWTSFWSQTFQSWDQVDPRDSPVDGLNLDWDRFVTHQTVDFMRNEIAPLKAARPAIPVTTNMMSTFVGLDYWRFTDVCDRMSWDAYPRMHGEDAWRVAVEQSFFHDLYRTMKGGLPFVLMESTPSSTNWMPTPQLKKPGQHRAEMLLAIGHGADTTMYFQWRKSQGAAEKMHGAVVDHGEAERTRVFQDVAAHGAYLRHLDGVVGTTVRPEVAVLQDWEVRWALMYTQGPRQLSPRAPFDKEYIQTCQDHYRPFWKLGVPVDVIESLSDFDRYRLIVAPMLFMLKPKVADRLDAFVKAGGVLVLTYLSGIVNESALVLRGGWPGGGLRKLAGVWTEEIDALYPDSPQRIVPAAGNALGLAGEHPVRDYCERVHPEGASVLATYKTDFYAGMPALTVNAYGSGRVYYLAARPAADAFLDGFTRALVAQMKLSRCLDVELPEGVTVQKRSGGGRTFYFLHNFRLRDQVVDLGPTKLRDAGDGRVLTGRTTLAPFASFVLEQV